MLSLTTLLLLQEVAVRWQLFAVANGQRQRPLVAMVTDWRRVAALANLNMREFLRFPFTLFYLVRIAQHEQSSNAEHTRNVLGHVCRFALHALTRHTRLRV